MTHRSIRSDQTLSEAFYRDAEAGRYLKVVLSSGYEVEGRVVEVGNDYAVLERNWGDETTATAVRTSAVEVFQVVED